MANIRKRDHGPADPWDPVLRHLPDHHGIAFVAGLLVAQNSPKAPDHSPAEKIMDPLQKLFFPQAEPLSQGFKGGRSDGQISLNLAD